MLKLTYIQYQLPYYGVEHTLFHYAKNGSVEKIEIWEEGQIMEKRVLYLVPYARQSSVQEEKESVFCVYGCPTEPDMKVRNGFYTSETYSLSMILNTLNRLWMDLQKWEIILLYSEEMDLNVLLDTSETILRMPLAVSDNRFHFLAKGQWYQEKFPTEVLDQDEMNELIWQEDFRQCLHRNSVFHLPLKTEKKDLLCYNIFISGRYYARVLGSVEDQKHGALQEELFTRLAIAVNSIFVNQRIHSFLTGRNSDLQMQVEALLDGEKKADETVMDRNHWSGEDHYKVMVLSFDARYPMEEGIRFLYKRLWELFPESCVLIREKDLICVRNLSRESQNENYRERMAVFLRENVAKAGSSNAFTGYEELPVYLQQAYEALRLGEKNAPYFWHYEFSDYMVPYLMERATSEYSLEQIVHPGLFHLMKYDKEKSSNLYQTLQIYLEHGGNATQTAEKLFIHRSSLMKRLDKIQSLTGIHLEKQEERFYVELSCRLLEYHKSHEK